MVAGGTVLMLMGILLFTGRSTPMIDTPAQMAAASAPTEAVNSSQDAKVVSSMGAADSGSDLTGLTFSALQFQIVYNITSFVLAAMGASTVFFFFHIGLVAKPFRTALTITGLVTLIAFYHYYRIFNSWNDAFVLKNGVVTATGIPFNDAYRYVDWLLTVPLLLMELVMVMRLGPEETTYQCTKLGSLAAIMVILGYPGEISNDSSTRWMFWAAAMVPFVAIVYSLFVGLSSSVAEQPKSARGLVDKARWITVLSWCTYPIVYAFPMLGITGASAHTAVQVGYCIADVIAKPLLGLVVWMIAARKSEDE